MTERSKKYIKDNLPYFGKIPTDTKRGKDVLAKKTWCITSQYVRMRDYIKYGVCVSCKSKIASWRDADPAHYHSFAGNGAFSAFNLLNIHLSCKTCNGFRGAAAGYEMAEELKNRYGDTILSDLYTSKLKTVKADDWYFIAKIEEVYSLFKELKEKHPDETYPPYL